MGTLGTNKQNAEDFKEKSLRFSKEWETGINKAQSLDDLE